MKVGLRPEPSPARVAGWMEGVRKRKRAAFKPEYKGLFEEGIDSKGNSVLTRRLNSLGVYEPYTGLVKVCFRRKEGGPRTIVRTDVYRAVRMTKHIEENYEKELEKNDNILREVARRNVELARGGVDRDEIKRIIKNLKIVIDSLKGIKVPTKTFSKNQLIGAVRLLEESINTADKIDMQKVTWACAKIVSFRTRYGNWRDKEIVMLRKYSELREYALRRLRDERLLENIARWVRYLEAEKRGFQMCSLWKRDMKFSEEITKVVDSKELSLEKINNLREALSAAGYKIRKIDRAYEALASNGARKAERELKDYAILLRVRNPFCIAEEMKKETDEYYYKAAAYLKTGAELIEKSVFDRAAYCFKEAAEEIKRRKAIPQMSLSFPSRSL